MSESQTQGKGLLLISNSTLQGSGYLDHAEREIRDALGAIKRVLFIPFALHDRDPDPNSTHMGETREVRINQFLEDNETPVVGLREGCMIRVEQGVHLLKGRTNARIFRRGFDPIELEPGSTL